jgi:hypothetical protein
MSFLNYQKYQCPPKANKNIKITLKTIRQIHPYKFEKKKQIERLKKKNKKNEKRIGWPKLKIVLKKQFSKNK